MYAAFIHGYDGEDGETWNLATGIHLGILNLATLFREGKRWQSVALRAHHRSVKLIHFHLQSANNMSLSVEMLQQVAEPPEEKMVMGDIIAHLMNMGMRWLHKARYGNIQEVDPRPPLQERQT